MFSGDTSQDSWAWSRSRMSRLSSLMMSYSDSFSMYTSVCDVSSDCARFTRCLAATRTMSDKRSVSGTCSDSRAPLFSVKYDPVFRCVFFGFGPLSFGLAGFFPAFAKFRLFSSRKFFRLRERFFPERSVSGAFAAPLACARSSLRLRPCGARPGRALFATELKPLPSRFVSLRL